MNSPTLTASFAYFASFAVELDHFVVFYSPTYSFCCNNFFWYTCIKSMYIFFLFSQHGIQFKKKKNFKFCQIQTNRGKMFCRTCCNHWEPHASTCLFQALPRGTSVLSGSLWNPRIRWLWGDPRRHSTALSTASSLPRCTGRKMAFCSTWTIAGRSCQMARCSSAPSCTPNTTNPTRASTSAWLPLRTWARSSAAPRDST